MAKSQAWQDAQAAVAALGEQIDDVEDQIAEAQALSLPTVELEAQLAALKNQHDQAKAAFRTVRLADRAATKAGKGKAAAPGQMKKAGGGEPA
jgi:predicted  nucleic acid-binding Zn-ribbon protein